MVTSPPLTPLPDLVYAEASVRSQGGVSLFDAPTTINSENVPNYYAEASLTEAAISELTAQGFQVQQVSPTTIRYLPWGKCRPGPSSRLYRQGYKSNHD